MKTTLRSVTTWGMGLLGVSALLAFFALNSSPAALSSRAAGYGDVCHWLCQCGPSHTQCRLQAPFQQWLSPCTSPFELKSPARLSSSQMVQLTPTLTRYELNNGKELAVDRTILGKIEISQDGRTGKASGTLGSDAVPLTYVSQPAAAAIPGGDELVAEAARALFRQRSVAAKVRQRVDLFGQRLVGSGTYLQLGGEDDKLLRLELRIPVGDRITSMQQVCDGRFLWIHRNLPGEVSVRRVDLRAVRQAVGPAEESLRTPGSQTWMALGGLPRLVQQLGENFTFGPAEAVTLADVPAWRIRGRWKPERLTGEPPVPAAEDEKTSDDNDTSDVDKKRPADVNLDKLSPHLPHEVELIVGRDDLFPYRIDFQRRESGANEEAGANEHQEGKQAANARAGFRSLVTLELFEVQLGGAIDPLQFAYQPGDLEVTDYTKEYLRALGVE